MSDQKKQWPSLSYAQCKETLETLHMYMQIIGKFKLKLNPFLNQWWEVAFYVNSVGITTEPIYYGQDIFEIEFNFILHEIKIRISDGREERIFLQSKCVKDFYGELMDVLISLNIEIDIYPVPVEIANPIPFEKDDVHCIYDKDCAERWWKILISVNHMFDRFRSSFSGKSSPIHFFWGSFDLSGSRFSGQAAEPPNMKGVIGKIMKFAENEENFAFGFWPGDERYPAPAFYSYMYPQPKGIEDIKLGSSLAFFDAKLAEFILPYEEVIKTDNPEREIEIFLETSYLESARLAGWNIESLKNHSPFDSENSSVAI